MDTEDGYIQIDHAEIQPWKDWEPNNVIATLSGPAESEPLLQMESSIVPGPLYEFKLTADHTLTISTCLQKVEAAWRMLTGSYRLERATGNEFPLSDVYCFLQTDMKLPIPSKEAAALRECVRTVATEAVKRLQDPNFALLRDRCPILQCELHTFTLCLRIGIEEQSEVLIQTFLGDVYAWAYGKLVQVMTTKTQTFVELTIKHGGDAQGAAPKYEICQHVSDLNRQGAYFCNKGLGYAGRILKLPKETRPPRFCPAHIC